MLQDEMKIWKKLNKSRILFSTGYLGSNTAGAQATELIDRFWYLGIAEKEQSPRLWIYQWLRFEARTSLQPQLKKIPIPTRSLVRLYSNTAYLDSYAAVQSLENATADQGTGCILEQMAFVACTTCRKLTQHAN